jgi:hypothetical protein
MKINIEEINEYYKNFLDESQKTLQELFENGDMSGEDQAVVVAKIIEQSMSKSLEAVKLGYELELIKTQTQTETIKQDRQYGAIVDENGNINYSITGNSVIEKQIAGFDLSNLKSIQKDFQQAVGMMYNSGKEVPSWYMDVIKKTTEMLSNGKIDFTVASNGDTTLKTGTDWKS